MYIVDLMFYPTIVFHGMDIDMGITMAIFVSLYLELYCGNRLALPILPDFVEPLLLPDLSAFGNLPDLLDLPDLLPLSFISLHCKAWSIHFVPELTRE